MVASPRAGASSWTPIGSPSSPTPNGTDMAGSPDRFDGIVHTSFMYIDRGSAVLAPSSNAVVGDVGERSTSNCSYAAWKSRMMSVRTCCALP